MSARVIEPGGETPADIVNTIRCLALSAEAALMERIATDMDVLGERPGEGGQLAISRQVEAELALREEVVAAERMGVLGAVAELLALSAARQADEARS